MIVDDGMEEECSAPPFRRIWALAGTRSGADLAEDQTCDWVLVPLEVVVPSNLGLSFCLGTEGIVIVADAVGGKGSSRVSQDSW